MAAPTLVFANAVPVTTTTATSSSDTFVAGDVCTVLSVGNGSGSGAAFNTPTTTLAGQSWTALQSVTAGAPAAHCEGGAWTFTASAGGAGTVTDTDSSAGSPVDFTLGVFVHRGASAANAGRSASAASSSRTLSYTSQQPDSAIVWAVGDWAAATAQTPTPTSTSHAAGSPGPTAMPSSAAVASQYTHYHAVLDDQPSTGAVSYGIGGTGTGPFTIVVVEIQGSGGTTAAPTHPRSMSRVPAIRAANF